MNKFFIYFFVLFLLSSFVSAVPPFAGTATGEFITKGLIIDYNSPKYFSKGVQAELNFHVFNQSNGILLGNSSVSCLVHIFNSTGHIILDQAATGKDYLFVLNATFNKSQIYGWTLHCNNSYIGGYISDSFTVTATGNGNVSDPLPQIIVFLVVATLFLMLALNLGEVFFWIRIMLSIVGVLFLQVSTNLVHIYSIDQGASQKIISFLSTMNLAMFTTVLALGGTLIIIGIKWVAEEWQEHLTRKNERL